MTNFDFFVLFMGTTIVGCSIWGFVKVKDAGCLVVGFCWVLAIIATLTHLGKPNPFCH